MRRKRTHRGRKHGIIYEHVEHPSGNADTAPNVVGLSWSTNIHLNPISSGNDAILRASRSISVDGWFPAGPSKLFSFRGTRLVYWTAIPGCKNPLARRGSAANDRGPAGLEIGMAINMLAQNELDCLVPASIPWSYLGRFGTFVHEPLSDGVYRHGWNS